MKKIFFIAVFGMFIGCKFMSGHAHKPQPVVKKAEKVKKKAKPAPETDTKPLAKPVVQNERGFTVAIQAISEVCTFVPNHVDALFFASGKEAQNVIDSLASGIPSTTGIRHATRFFRMLKTRFGLKALDKVSEIMVIESKGRVLVFAKDMGIEVKNRETYSAGKYKFALAKLPNVRILSGRFNDWAVIGDRDVVMKLAVRRPLDAKDNCKRLRQKITTVLGPNIRRDPFNMGVGVIISLSTAIFWNSEEGMRVLAPVKGNLKGIQGITAFVRTVKQSFSRLQAESDAGAPALYPTGRMKKADLAIITLKEQRRADMLVLDARGSLVDLILAVYQQKLRPFLGKRPRSKK